MKTGVNSLNSDQAVDLDLAKIVEQLTDQILRNPSFNVDAFIEQHPEHAEHIRQLLPAMQVLAVAGVDALPSGSSGPSSSDRAGAYRGNLGDFRILREIGRGGMGVVYEAEQLSLGRRVALKVLPFAGVLNEKTIKRFKNEARAAASLEHPNIVPVHAVSHDRGVHFFAMSLIDGLTLAQVISDLRKRATSAGPQVGDKLSIDLIVSDKYQLDAQATESCTSQSEPDQASRTSEAATHKDIQAVLATKHSLFDRAYFRRLAEIGIQVAEALHYAHEHGIVHRDIKPGNLMIDTSGKLWVTDFGLAQMENDPGMTMTGDLVGTIRYMSPEQALCKREFVDHRTDIYSLGATLYELLTLQPVFAGRDHQELMRQIAFEEPQPPRRVSQAIPHELAAIVLKAIEKNPHDRYVTAQELADDLQRFRRQEPIRARRATVSQRSKKWILRHQALTWAVVLTLLAVSLISMVAGAMVATTNGRLETANNELQKEKTEAVRQRDAAFRQELVVRQREATNRRYLYGADMRLACQYWIHAWDYADLDEVRRLLARYEPTSDQEELRSFAWYYLKRLCGQTPRSSLVGHDGRVYSVAISPDGKTLATASQDKTAKLWDLATGQLRHTLQGHTDEVNCVAFAPDSQTLATASDDGTIKFWDSVHGQEQSSRALPKFSMPVGHVEFSADGKLLVTGECSAAKDEGAATLWDLSSRRQRWRLQDHYPLALSPSGDLLATTRNDKEVRLWTTADGQERSVLRVHIGGVNTGMFSPDGQILATGSDDGTVVVWDVDTGQRTTGFEAWPRLYTVRSLAFSPDQKLLATGDEVGAVRLFELSQRRPQTALGGNTPPVWSVMFSRDGRTLASATEDGTVNLWDVYVTHRGKSPPDQPNRITSISFSADSELLAASIDQEPSTLWNVPTGDPLALTPNAPAGNVLCLAFSPSGRALASATSDGIVQLVDQVTGAQRLVIACPGMSIASLVFSPDGRMLAGDFKDGVRVWDTKSREELYSLQLRGHTPGRQRVAFSPDGKTLAVQIESYVKRLDLADGVLRDLRTGGADCLAYSPDGQTLAVGAGRRIRLWDMRTDEEKVNLRGHAGLVGCLAFSPDGRTLASGGDTSGSEKGELKLWDLASMQELFGLVGHTGSVDYAAFSPDGQTLATAGASVAGERGEIRFWRTAKETIADFPRKKIVRSRLTNP